MPGTIELSTCPNIPSTRRPPISSEGISAMWQAEVPRLSTTVPQRIPAPTAPAWASMLPTPTTTPSGSPSACVHAGVIVPAAWSHVRFVLLMLRTMGSNAGSSASKNASGGNPPQASAHICFDPAAQWLARIAEGSSAPVSTAGIQSQSSTMAYASRRSRRLPRSRCRHLAQKHSAE